MRWTPALGEEQLLLDLLNSTPVTRSDSVDLLDDEQVHGWARARGGVGTAGEARTLRRTRRLLQSVVRGDIPAAELEPAARHLRLRPRVGDTGLDWQPDVDHPDHRLAARALLAWGVVTEQLPGRLRACANPECGLFLLDRSRANTARWCSMSRCGNRMKARRHYQRGRRPAARS
ncbi:CGNR zinc finger domain-containing protein [Pseudonocardia spinosispora]|uniref:CGNR zinc finger domain-containing protein n=1 Tax=Pseudonocardia spinosispora TaxID=103441 RepID=UPI000408E3D2|nr:CGNR zinc finger domain-containing protein [Pseudonocardia spinosispora]